jgi:hypothetical protein
MLARNNVGVGFLRGLNSAAEVFAPYSSEHERSPLGQMRSDWSGVTLSFHPAFTALSPT